MSYFIVLFMICFVAAIAGMSRHNIAGYILSGLVALFVSFLAYSGNVTISLSFVSFYFMIFFAMLMSAVLNFFVIQDGDTPVGVAAPVIMFLVIIGGGIYSSAMFHSESYRQLLGNVQQTEFENAIELVDHSIDGRGATAQTLLNQSSVRLVDAQIARRRAQELLGSDATLGSQFSIGAMNIQLFQGRLTWVAPLEYNGLRRWWAGGGVPGYITVDANDLRMARLVQKNNGQDIRMMCGLSHWFSQGIERIARLHDWDAGLVDFSFEIDESGRPFWVVSTFKNTIGFSGAQLTGALVIDAQTCKPVHYTTESAPSWVDRIVPDDLAIDQVDYWGEYVHGWLNSTFGAGRDILNPSGRMELVYSSTGRAFWYTGLHTPGNPSGTTGFIMVDARTKEAIRFNRVGASESAAVNAIAGAISNMRGWTVSSPILYNIFGRPTYLSTLKDEAGNFKGVALISVENRSLVATGDTFREALTAYSNVLTREGGGNANTGIPLVEKTGRVTRSQVVTVEGRSLVIFMLENINNAFSFEATTPAAALLRENDTVKIGFREASDIMINVESLENTSLNVRRSLN